MLVSQGEARNFLYLAASRPLLEVVNEGLLDGVRNLRVSVKEAGDHIIFLRKVEPGRADRSYGIEVARLAGLPLSVIERYPPNGTILFRLLLSFEPH